MDRLSLERRQVWVYLLAIFFGLAAGKGRPEFQTLFQSLVWPTLGALLFVTFLQVPLLHLHQAFADRRFVTAVLVGNFLCIPLLVSAAITLLPANPPLRLGVLLVLLTPCTDWFITFTQLGKGSPTRAIAITPVNLILQLLLIGVLLTIWGPDIDPQSGRNTGASRFLPFADGHTDFAVMLPFLLLLATLVLGALTSTLANRHEKGRIWLDRLAWFPVPLLATLLFLVSATHVATIIDAKASLLVVLPLFAIFPLLVAWLARGLSNWLQLPVAAGRTLAFSMGTRNSFVVLPIALALPAGWELTAIVIVFQSLVELLGMVFCLWWLPNHLFKG
jgi:Arsenite efflux pump ACR3 and related permeases